MRYALLYVVVRLMLEALIVRGLSEARLRAEVLALRHQLGVLERQVGRPRWQPSDRHQPRSAQARLAIAHAQAGDAAPLASGAGAA